MMMTTEDVGKNSATETLQLSRRLAGWIPRWHPWITYHGSADWRIDGESASAESRKRKESSVCKFLNKNKEITAIKIKALKE